MNDAQITPLFIDTNIDDILSATYDRHFNPQLFVLHNDTRKVYSWEYNMNISDSVDWILNKTYLESKHSFEA